MGFFKLLSSWFFKRDGEYYSHTLVYKGGRVFTREFWGIKKFSLPHIGELGSHIKRCDHMVGGIKE